MSRHSAKNVHCKLLLFFSTIFFSRVFLQIANYQSHCIPLIRQLRICIEIFQLIDYLLHGWSRPRISLLASPYQATKRAICYKYHLFFTPSGIWKLPDAHFTKKNTKAVNINLTTMHYLNKSTFFSLGCLWHITVKVWGSWAPQPNWVNWDKFHLETPEPTMRWFKRLTKN